MALSSPRSDSSAAALDGTSRPSVCQEGPAIRSGNAGSYADPRGHDAGLDHSADETAAEESETVFYTAADIARLAEKDVTWIAKPWIAERALIVLDGKPKAAGKTTFLSHLIRKVLSGEAFLAEHTTRTPVVLLTEERPLTFRRILERGGLLESSDLHVLFRDQVHGDPWEQVALSARERCHQVGAKLLVVDTLGAFAPGYEQSPAAMRAALGPLYHAARAGLAVLAVRHERKSGGTVGESGMGSTVMTAGVDIVLALQRPKNSSGPGRMLYARSRFEETPEQTAIQLHDGEFVRMPALDLSAEEIERALFAAAPTDPGCAKSADELMFATSLKKTTTRSALEHLCAKGKLTRTGTGTRGSPFRYYRRPLEIVS